jgi:hypothetical protein
MTMDRKIIKNSTDISNVDIRPPNSPWIPLSSRSGNKAAFSFYYSDPFSILPVREVSHKNDPKADPNIETFTHGLFSTCDRGMRATIVREGINLLFFCTNRKDGRVLTGYYRIGWYYELPHSTLDDYMLAAEEGKFVSPGFPLQDLTGYLYGVRLDKRFRTFRYLDGETAGRLLRLLNDTPDATVQYISEIHRLEQLTSEKEGYVYQNKYTHFGWDVAHKPMKLES